MGRIRAPWNEQGPTGQIRAVRDGLGACWTDQGPVRTPDPDTTGSKALRDRLGPRGNDQDRQNESGHAGKSRARRTRTPQDESGPRGTQRPCGTHRDPAGRIRAPQDRTHRHRWRIVKTPGVLFLQSGSQFQRGTRNFGCFTQM